MDDSPAVGTIQGYEPDDVVFQFWWPNVHWIAVLLFAYLSSDIHSVAMAQMQMVIAAIYAKYNTRISPRTTDESMEVVDQITSAGPAVQPQLRWRTNL
jgi:hypothetical protein